MADAVSSVSRSVGSRSVADANYGDANSASSSKNSSLKIINLIIVLVGFIIGVVGHQVTTSIQILKLADSCSTYCEGDKSNKAPKGKLEEVSTQVVATVCTPCGQPHESALAFEITFITLVAIAFFALLACAFVKDRAPDTILAYLAGLLLFIGGLTMLLSVVYVEPWLQERNIALIKLYDKLSPTWETKYQYEMSWGEIQVQVKQKTREEILYIEHRAIIDIILNEHKNKFKPKLKYWAAGMILVCCFLSIVAGILRCVDKPEKVADAPAPDVPVTPYTPHVGPHHPYLSGVPNLAIQGPSSPSLMPSPSKAPTSMHQHQHKQQPKSSHNFLRYNYYNDRTLLVNQPWRMTKDKQSQVP